MDELLSDFLIETQGRLASLDPRFNEFLRTPNEAGIQADVLEFLHTVKGASVLLGLPRLEAVAHSAEDALSKARAGAIEMSPELAALVVDSIGAIRRIQRVIATTGTEPTGEDAVLLGQLKSAASGKSLKRPGSASPSAASPLPPSPLQIPPVPSGQLTPVQPSVSIPIEHIEHLTSLVGDLVLTRNNLNYLLRSREDAELEEPLKRLSDITSELGLGLISTRKQALGQFADNTSGMFEIVSAISIDCAGSRYAIPQRSVIELVRVTPSGGTVASDEIRLLRLRERRYPWLRLGSLLGVGRSQSSSGNREIVVMIEDGNGPIGLAVDDVIDIEEVVVRPLPPLLDGVGLFGGTTVLGDGTVALILEPRKLAAAFKRGPAPTIAHRESTPRLPSRD